MIKKGVFLLRRAVRMQRMNFSLARGAATAAMRQIDPKRPLSWEFSAFSQSGEDGIVDYLTRQILAPNRYFVEIGASDGLENNSSWLAIARKFNGLMVEGDSRLASLCRAFVCSLNLGVESCCTFVTRENAKELFKKALVSEPDFMSLDIDGNDYYVARALLEAGFRPKIFSVEFNSAFGPERAVTIPYQADFNFKEAHPTHLYYGVSIGAWRKWLERIGYRFVTVDSNGVNAFFIDPAHFQPDFLDGMKGLSFQENFYQRVKFRATWPEQFRLIQEMPLAAVD